PTPTPRRSRPLRSGWPPPRSRPERQARRPRLPAGATGPQGVEGGGHVLWQGGGGGEVPAGQRGPQAQGVGGPRLAGGEEGAGGGGGRGRRGGRRGRAGRRW